jgi:hypothetical protein
MPCCILAFVDLLFVLMMFQIQCFAKKLFTFDHSWQPDSWRFLTGGVSDKVGDNRALPLQNIPHHNFLLSIYKAAGQPDHYSHS